MKNEHATVSAFNALFSSAFDNFKVVTVDGDRPSVTTFTTNGLDSVVPAATRFKELPKPIIPEEWHEAEYREAYLLASIEQGIAWQIRANREGRNMSQAQLASSIGSRQSSISRMEDPEYGNHSLGTLVKLANAFQCALSVKFISFGQLAVESTDLSPRALFAAPFESECAHVESADFSESEYKYEQYPLVP
ncbi:helix-turn-helix transcriptional regulator [Achromobacter mucicolens]|uniref:helix-turn-helix domain-containing protein n=1 Tax=Achromobacter mucicolens TaxID=1389922 RepID=UPI002FE37CA1